MSLDQVGEEITFGEARDLVEELAKEFRSHLVAARQGWAFVAGYGELMAATHAEAFLNANRDMEKRPEPFVLLRPWQTSEGHGLSEAEVEELEIQLQERSAFR